MAYVLVSIAGALAAVALQVIFHLFLLRSVQKGRSPRILFWIQLIQRLGVLFCLLSAIACATGVLSVPEMGDTIPGMILLSLIPAVVWYAAHTLAGPAIQRWMVRQDLTDHATLPIWYVREAMFNHCLILIGYHVFILSAASGQFGRFALIAGAFVFLGFVRLIRGNSRKSPIHPLQEAEILDTPLVREIDQILRDSGLSAPIKLRRFAPKQQGPLDAGTARVAYAEWVRLFNPRRPTLYLEVLRQMPAESLKYMIALLAIARLWGVVPSWRWWRFTLVICFGAILAICLSVVALVLVADYFPPTATTTILSGFAWPLLAGLMIWLGRKAMEWMGGILPPHRRYAFAFDVCRKQEPELTLEDWVFHLLAGDLSVAANQEGLTAVLLGMYKAHKPMTRFLSEQGHDPVTFLDGLAERLEARRKEVAAERVA